VSINSSSTWFALVEDEDDDENEDDNESVVKRERDGARPGKTSKMARRISIGVGADLF
jgi:hypothetical protein